MDIINLPILGICGFSGSGKTTLIEELLVRLKGSGISLAVVKHSSKVVEFDQHGKDSYRFFSANADVCFHSAKEHFFRTRFSETFSLDIFLRNLARQYDLILVEGYKDAEIAKIILLDNEKLSPPQDKGTVLDILSFAPKRIERLLEIIDNWLPMQWHKVPVYGGILVGGESSRMGRPKHLIEKNGVTWLENTIHKIAPFCTEVVVVGDKEIPGHLKVKRLNDVSELHGPLSGMVAALRWNPWASWLMVACDLPDITRESIGWLLKQRKPGTWAVLPTVDDENVEPLFALYDFRIQNAIEEMIYTGVKKPSKLRKNNKVDIPLVPENLRSTWRNVNFLKDI